MLTVTSPPRITVPLGVVASVLMAVTISVVETALEEKI